MVEEKNLVNNGYAFVDQYGHEYVSYEEYYESLDDG